MPVPAASTTALYFGTFNPVHTGHLMIAQAVLNHFGPAMGIEKVAFIPAGNPPHRQGENGMLDARRRLKMVQLAIAEHPQLEAWELELHRTGKSYTIDTLRHLFSEGHTTQPAPLIIGADALANLATWHEPQALVQAACFLQAPRPGYQPVTHVSIDGQSLPLNTQIIPMPALALSSTWIREQLKTMPPSAINPLRAFLPEPVRRFIQDNHLYTL